MSTVLSDNGDSHEDAEKPTKSGKCRLSAADEAIIADGDGVGLGSSQRVADGDNEKDDGKDEAAETEDEDEKQYWELKLHDGVKRVSHMGTECLLISQASALIQPKKKHDATCDLRICYKKGVRKIEGTERPGAYCILCL